MSVLYYLSSCRNNIQSPVGNVGRWKLKNNLCFLYGNLLHYHPNSNGCYSNYSGIKSASESVM